ncbi:MAG: hypothetical protein ABIX46_12680 [Burkholderiaceae bacterium]
MPGTRWKRAKAGGAMQAIAFSVSIALVATIFASIASTSAVAAKVVTLSRVGLSPPAR